MGCGGSKSTSAEEADKKSKNKRTYLSATLRRVFQEDLELFLSLPNAVQNKMILSKVSAGQKSLKGKDTLKPLFTEADTNNVGALDFEAWKVFSAKLKAAMAEKYGDSYSLSDDQLQVRFDAFDLNKNGTVTLEEFVSAMKMKKTFYANHYPENPSQKLKEVWRDEYTLYQAMSQQVKDAYRVASKNEKLNVENKRAGVLWRLELFDQADANKDGKLNCAEFKTFYKLMEVKLKKEMGDAYNLSDKQLEDSHAAHDLDGNGQVSKDEVLWARKMKSKFYKAGVLTNELKAVFEEDLALFLDLSAATQTKMILAKVDAGKKSIKGKNVMEPLFNASCSTKDGNLNAEDWVVFSGKLEEYLTKKYGETYKLSQEQMMARHKAFDYNGNGKVSFKEFMKGCKMKSQFNLEYYPQEPTDALKKVWRHEFGLYVNLPKKVKDAFTAAGKKERKSTASIKAGVKWRLDMYDECDVDNDGKLNKLEYVAFYQAMEEHLRNEMGGAYHLTVEDLEASHSAHDLDGNGLITKDEVLWSRKLKGRFYKTMRLTSDLKQIFKEDLELFLSLPASVQNTMILTKISRKQNLKGVDVLGPLFQKSDTNGTGCLDFEQFKVFSGLLKTRMNDTYGGSYDLTEDQMNHRWRSFNLRGNRGVTLEDFLQSMDIKKLFYVEHYPQVPPQALKDCWLNEFKKYMHLSSKSKKVYEKEQKSTKTVEQICAGVQWRLEMFDVADADNDGKLNVDEYKAYYRLMEDHLKIKMGEAYHLKDKELEQSHTAHDFDGNGLISKDEVLWSRRMKTDFYKSMRLTDEMTLVFIEDQELAGKLPAKVLNKMICQKVRYALGEKSKSGGVLAKLFKKADLNNSGRLNAEEFGNFSNLIKKGLESKYGGAYKLTQVQTMARWKAYDLRGNGGVTLEDFKQAMLLRTVFQHQHYATADTKGLKVLWRSEHKKYRRLDHTVRAKYKAASFKCNKNVSSQVAGVQWRLDLFDQADENNDGKLNLEEWKTFYKLMEEKLTKDMGGAYHLSDEELVQSHKVHDIDGNGQVTKDEVLWARHLKHKYYKTMKLTPALKEVFEEDLELFLGLSPEVQNKTILYKYDVWFHLQPAGSGTLKQLFKAADTNGNERLALDEWKVFSNSLKERNEKRFGASYTLNDAQLEARWRAYDLRQNGGVTMEDFLQSMKIQELFYSLHYPKEPSEELVKMWEHENTLWKALSQDIKDKFKAQHDAEAGVPEKIKEGIMMRLELFDQADANKDGRLDKPEFVQYYRLMEEKLKATMGGSYHLSDEELEQSHSAHDLDGNGQVTKDEVLWARKMKMRYYQNRK